MVTLDNVFYEVTEEKCIQKALYKILYINPVYDVEDSDYVTLATCINDKSKIETISIDDFFIEDDIEELTGCFIEIEINALGEYSGYIFKKNKN